MSLSTVCPLCEAHTHILDQTLDQVINQVATTEHRLNYQHSQLNLLTIKPQSQIEEGAIILLWCGHSVIHKL